MSIASPILAFCVGVFVLSACSSGGQVAATDASSPPASGEQAQEPRSETARSADAIEPIEITGDTTGAATDTVHVADTSPEIIGGMRALLPFVNYPPEAKKKGLEEKVIVRFVVTREGTATGFRTLQGEHQILVDAITHALKQVEFRPGRRNGAPTNVYMTIPFTFQSEYD